MYPLRPPRSWLNSAFHGHHPETRTSGSLLNRLLGHPSSQSDLQGASLGSLDRAARFWYENPMDIGKRLRELREAKGLSQRDIEKRTGFLQGYVSRVECGHAPPSLATLEKWANALDLELYQLFYKGKGEPAAREVPESMALDRREEKLVDLFRRMPESVKNLFLGLAREAVKRQSEVRRPKT